MINCIGAAPIGLFDKTLSAPSVTIRWLLWIGLQLLFYRERYIVEQCCTGSGFRLTLAGGYRVLRRGIIISIRTEKLWKPFI